jgi:acetyltransferase-like isoleucine patch superfamily enzyme
MNIQSIQSGRSGLENVSERVMKSGHSCVWMKRLGVLCLACYKGTVRIKAKCFSLLIGGAFAEFGRRTVLMPPVRLSGEWDIALGSNIFIGPGSWLQTLTGNDTRAFTIVIGDRTSIAGACVVSAAQQVIIGEDVLVARNVYISDHMHKHTATDTPIIRQGLDRIAPVQIKRGAWLGQNVVICPGVTVGEGAVIGANSVVTGDIPDFAVAVGAPARVVRIYARVQDRESS